MSDLILNCNQSGGEVLLLTSAVRDLHRSLPGMFRTDVRSPFPELWENNPYLTPLNENDSTISIECRNSLLPRCNELPVHSIYGYISDLNEQLHINIKPTGFKPDVHLSAEEKMMVSPAETLAGWKDSYWILNAGCSSKQTVKQWEVSRYRQVVDHYRETIRFVQIGLAEDLHPALDNVIDLRGKTTLRELIRLVYHAEGILTSPGLLVHLAAAVETENQRLRSCVVIGGGREPMHWSAYPGQQYLNAIGKLPCCRTGGCWRSRTVPLADGEIEDEADHLCISVSDNVPLCMRMIGVPDVVFCIDQFLQRNGMLNGNGQHEPLTNPPGLRGVLKVVPSEPLTALTARIRTEEFIEQLDPYPGKHSDRGIVICAGGLQLFANAWVCIHMLRHLGCQLPIQIWHLGSEEVDGQMKSLVKHLNVTCVDALEVRRQYPARQLGGWELKPYAIIHSPFKEVLLLDADNVPVVNPEFLFDTPQFKETGAIFWPDFGHLKPDASIWKLCGILCRDECEWESGQIVVDKERCWKPLLLTMWFNEHSDFFYKHILGDKETFHMAFRKLGYRAAMPEHSVQALNGILCQHDFDGRRIFQHRSSRKWRVLGENPRVPGLLFEEECLSFLRQFRQKCDKLANLITRIDLDTKSPKERDYIHEIAAHAYEYVRVGFDQRQMTFSLKGCIETGRADCEKYWDVREEEGRMVFEIYNESAVICRLAELADGNWRGRWLHFEQMPVELRIICPPLETPCFPRCPIVGPREEVERKRILFRAPLNGYTGYGLHSIQIIQDFVRMGYTVDVRATHLNETYAPIPMDVRKHIVCRDISDRWDLVLLPPAGFSPRAGTKSLVFTMWESTRISPDAVNRLNQAYQIVVPCHWNASCFNACGVDRPINVIPLGINTRLFKYFAMDMEGPCVFGTAGRLESGGMRKGIHEVVQAFQEAFPDTKEVRLRIKIFPDDELPEFDDERIEVIGRYLNETELVKWFSELTCFVSCSHGEAWGLMLHQALAVGRPVISVLYGGSAEFLTEEMSYPLDFRLVPAGGFYKGFGLWAEAERSNVVEQMKRVFKDRAEARAKGDRGSRSISHLTWDNSNAQLLNVMKNIGMVI